MKTLTTILTIVGLTVLTISCARDATLSRVEIKQNADGSCYWEKVEEPVGGVTISYDPSNDPLAKKRRENRIDWDDPEQNLKHTYEIELDGLTFKAYSAKLEEYSSHSLINQAIVEATSPETLLSDRDRELIFHSIVSQKSFGSIGAKKMLIDAELW